MAAAFTGPTTASAHCAPGATAFAPMSTSNEVTPSVRAWMPSPSNAVDPTRRPTRAGTTMAWMPACGAGWPRRSLRRGCRPCFPRGHDQRVRGIVRVRNDELPESTHETSPMVVVIIAGVVTVFLVGMLIRLLYPPTRSSATRVRLHVATRLHLRFVDVNAEGGVRSASAFDRGRSSQRAPLSRPGAPRDVRITVVVGQVLGMRQHAFGRLGIPFVPAPREHRPPRQSCAGRK